MVMTMNWSSSDYVCIVGSIYLSCMLHVPVFGLRGKDVYHNAFMNQKGTLNKRIIRLVSWLFTH